MIGSLHQQWKTSFLCLWTNGQAGQMKKRKIISRTKFCYYQHNKDAPKKVTDKDNLIKVSKTAGQVKKKENQTTRVRSTRTRNTPKRKADVVQSLDNDFLNQLRAKILNSNFILLDIINLCISRFWILGTNFSYVNINFCNSNDVCRYISI